jgi:hypothetical protein
LPAGPVIGERVSPRGVRPNSLAAANASRNTIRWIFGSRTTPPLPTCSAPASNWGLINATIQPVASIKRCTAGKTIFSEMNDTSITAASASTGARSLASLAAGGRSLAPLAAGGRSLAPLAGRRQRAGASSIALPVSVAPASCPLPPAPCLLPPVLAIPQGGEYWFVRAQQRGDHSANDNRGCHSQHR